MCDMLRNHLGWKKNNAGFESRFISVTSSPLVALQLTVQKHARMKREERAAKKLMKEADEKSETNAEQEEDEDPDNEFLKKKVRVNVPEGNIYVCILGTSKLPKATAFYKANAMIGAYQNGKPLMQNQDFFITEYLVWENLKANSCHVPFDTLLEKGFPTLFDEFKQSPDTLQVQVQDLRNSLYDWAPYRTRNGPSFRTRGSALQ